MKEQDIQTRIMLALSRAKAKIFRNNVGVGWQSVVVTPEMVGARIAVFTAVEVKQPKKKPTEAQRNFIDLVLSQGGYAGVATSEGEALDVLRIRPE